MKVIKTSSIPKKLTKVPEKP